MNHEFNGQIGGIVCVGKQKLNKNRIMDNRE